LTKTSNGTLLRCRCTRTKQTAPKSSTAICTKTGHKPLADVACPSRLERTHTKADGGWHTHPKQSCTCGSAKPPGGKHQATANNRREKTVQKPSLRQPGLRVNT
jgi:hypothetical protein